MSTVKYTLALNKKYTITTYGLTYVNTSVQVIGIINYAEALRLDDIKVIGLNEKIIDDDYDSYFSNIEFYKCKILDSNDVIVVWADIIDSSKSSLIGETYTYKMTLEISALPSAVSKETVLTALTTAAAALNTSLTFKIVTDDENSSVDVFQERLTATENVMRSLLSLSTITPVLDSLNRDELSTKLDTINTNIDTISTKLETIASGL